MTIRQFNLSNLIKASMIIILSLMLNIAHSSSAFAMDGFYAGTTYHETMRDMERDYEEYQDSKKCTVDTYRKQHQSGCWSCLVLERLTSAFLNAAKHGLPITQKIGVGLLILGTILWVMKWGLDNVSSFTEIQLPNILNALFTTCFKVLLAYWFIVLSSTAIGQYFVRPIMSVGAIIGENLWDTGMKRFMTPWSDLSETDLTADATNAQNQQEENQADEDDMNQEVLEQLEALREKDESSPYDVPPFQMPGCSGKILSFPGCRIPMPIKSQTDCSSNSNMGLDIEAQNGATIWAVAGGDILYLKNGAWGNTVKIVTKHKGATWTHLYAHMNDDDWNKYKEYFSKKGNKVSRGEIIGGVGNSGNANGYLMHMEIILSGTVDGKTYNNAVLDPISLGEGKIVERGKKSGSATGAAVEEDCACGTNGNPGCSYHSSWSPPDKAIQVEENKNKICRGFNSGDPVTSIKKGQTIPNGGITNAGTTPEPIISADTSFGGSGFYVSAKIPSVAYTGPTNIVPAEITNSMLGAMRSITDTTAETMVLGKMIMCYSNLPKGGAIKISLTKDHYIINLFRWLQGLAIFIVGFMLTASIAYYFLDISFKLGFCVLALPITAGLWPFKMTEKKIITVLSIMMRASASFAFMAIVTTYGMSLVSESTGGLDEVYTKMEDISQGATDEQIDELNDYIQDAVGIFSANFLILMAAIYYFYKLVSETCEKLTGKFFKDSTFGSSNPMHQMATKGTSKAFNKAKKYSGFNLAKDYISNKTVGKVGDKVKSKIARGGRAVGSKVAKGAKKIVDKLR